MVAVRRSPCDPDQLALLVQDQLPLARRQQLIRHLDACPSCCQQLEQLAADHEFWRATRRFLGADTREPNRISDGPSPRGDHPVDTLIALPLDGLEPSDHPHSLGRLDQYEIFEVIGRGGSGVVLKGYEPELNRIVAIKVLSPHVAGHGAARQRFEREAKAAAAVVHPHVVAIHGINSRARLPYLVMSWVNGNSLEQRLRRDGPLPLRDVLRISQQIAEGLAAAHDQGLVHRDIKPANIMLEENVDRVSITDFGLARAVDDATLTCSGMIAGTPAYMSPEQARGEEVGPASDLFSLGSVMHAMCTGESPFTADNTVAVLRRVSDGEPRAIRRLNPDVPRWLVDLIGRLHAKSPTQRLGSAHEVADVLKQCLAHVQEPDRRPLPREASSQRPRWPVVAVLVICIGLIASGRQFVPLAPPKETGDTQHNVHPGSSPRTVPPPSRAVTAPESFEDTWSSEIAVELVEIESEIQRLEWQANE